MQENKENGYKFWSAKYDYTFKCLFFKKENNDILEAILSEIFGEKVKINPDKTRNGELLSSNVHVKRKFVDAVFRGEKKIYQVELNTENENDVKKRNACFLFTLYNNETKRSKSYKSDVLTLQINLSYRKSSDKLFETYFFQTDNNKKWIEDLEILSINMEKLKESCYNEEERKKYKYLLMLDYSLEELDKYSKGDKIMSKFKDEVESLNEDPDFQDFMSEAEDKEMMQNTIMDKRVEESKKEGIKEGEKSGIMKSKLETARNMLKKKFSIKDISEITGLKTSEIEKIKL